MVELRPVRAWHPNPVSSVANDLVCPVYDTLSDADVERFARHRHNAAGFVPRPASVPLDRFLPTAAGRLREAIRAGSYVQDVRPGFYVYGIRYTPPPDILETIEPDDRRKEYLLLGLVGCLDFETIAHGDVALHERTFEDRVLERVALTEETGMNFAPILTAYHRPDHSLNDYLEDLLGLDRRMLSFAGSVVPVVEATLDGTTHRLWRIESADAVAELESLVLELRLLILDGHHRFTAAARRHHAGRLSAPLVMLVDGQDRALRVMPWHRVLPGGVVPPSELWAAAVREFPGSIDRGDTASPERAIERLGEMHRAGRRGFLVADGRRMLEVNGPPSDDVGADFDLLHTFLEERLGLDPHTLEFVRSPRQALERVQPPGTPTPRGSALLLPALTERGIEQRAFDRGAIMAHKSTMFLPKVAEGVIFAPADGSA